MELKDFHYRVTGVGAEASSVPNSAPWVIFIHGLLGAGANWRRITPAFEGDFRVLVYDQRGHGKSFKPARGYAPEDFADDLKFLMDELKIEKAFIVGHSMGGRNALTFTYKYPERVEKLVIEDIGPEAYVQDESSLVARLRSVPVPFPNKKAAKEYLLTHFPDPKLGQYFYTSIKELPNGQATWIFDLDVVAEIISLGRGVERWYELEGIRCPTLVVRGSESDELSRDVFEKMKACGPWVKGVEIAGAGHWVHFDKPDEFISIVRDFILSP